MPKTSLLPEFNSAERRGNATLFLDREGRWFHEGLEITHGRTCLLFSKNLARDETGRYYVRVGGESAEVDVEDTPYTVKSVTIQKGPGRLPTDYILHLNDDTQESLSSRPLTVNENNVMYCLVKGGSERARFLRAAYYQVCSQLHYDEETEEYWLPWREMKIRIQSDA